MRFRFRSVEAPGVWVRGLRGWDESRHGVGNGGGFLEWQESGRGIMYF